MFNNFWKLIKQQDYISFLERELETVRQEKTALQGTLHHVLRIHLIPKDLNEMREAPANTPVSISRPRNIRSALNELQKKSFDEATRKRIEEVEDQINSDKVISELEPTGSDDLKEY
jgi:hypothetical protein